jgi:hypothetical protein
MAAAFDSCDQFLRTPRKIQATPSSKEAADRMCLVRHLLLRERELIEIVPGREFSYDRDVSKLALRIADARPRPPSAVNTHGKRADITRLLWRGSS